MRPMSPGCRGTKFPSVLAQISASISRNSTRIGGRVLLARINTDSAVHSAMSAMQPSSWANKIGEATDKCCHAWFAIVPLRAIVQNAAAIKANPTNKPTRFNFRRWLVCKS